MTKYIFVTGGVVLPDGIEGQLSQLNDDDDDDEDN